MRVLPLVSVVLAASAGAAPFPPRLVVASGLRVRDAPQPGATLIERVAIGTVLPCLEQSGPVRVGSQVGPFCRTRLEGGREGWFFVPLTAELEAAPEAQLDRLVSAKLEELQGVGEERRSDVYDLHQLALRRIDAAQERPGKLRAKLDELRLLQAHPDAFHADPRIYRDDAQGLRLRREAIWSLVDEAKGTPTAEAAGWLAVQHGHDFECEGDPACAVSWLAHVECEYLARFPDGAHAGQALTSFGELADWVAEEAAATTPEEELLPLLEKAQQCVAGLKGTTAGDARRALTRAVAAVRKSRARSARPPPVSSPGAAEASPPSPR
jgi:hypothetical protein